MISIGPLYADLINYPIYKWLPLVELGWTNEVDEPYRHGKCVVLKPPALRKAIVLGVWRSRQDEETALSNAIMATPMAATTEEIMEW